MSRQSVTGAPARLRTASRLARTALAIGVGSLALSGCLLQSMLGFVDPETGNGRFSVNASVGPCSPGDGPGSVDCEYGVTGSSASSRPSFLGEVGGVVDPVVLQVPDELTITDAVYNVAGSDEPLTMTETTSFPATPTTTVSAETGTRFVILELPDELLSSLPEGGLGVDYSVEFSTPSPSTTVVKPMFTAAFDIDGTRYYPPLFPCVTDFSAIPEVQIPQASTLQDLRPALSELISQRDALACDGVVYDMRAAQVTPPVTGPPIWVPVEPARVVDTRPTGETVDGLDRAGGMLTGGTELRAAVAGRAGVPDDARAVIANITAVQPGAKGFLTAHPCVTPLPLAASLNYTPGVNLGNEVMVGLDDGDLCVFTFADTHLTVDVVGYVPSVDGSSDAPRYRPIEPSRYFESRPVASTFDGVAGGGRLEAGETVEVTFGGRGEVPADAEAVVAYVTAVAPGGTGFVTTWDCDGTRPLASSLNHVAGVDRGNEVVIALDHGAACAYVFDDTHLTIDVVGYVETGTNFTGLDAPVRLLDTRPTGVTVDGQSQRTGPTDAGGTLELQLAGRGGVDTDAETVVLNLTAVQPGGIGYVTAAPCGTTPNAASLNHVPGVNGGNEIVVSLDDQGRVCLFTSASTHLTVDVTGYTTSTA